MIELKCFFDTNTQKCNFNKKQKKDVWFKTKEILLLLTKKKKEKKKKYINVSFFVFVSKNKDDRRARNLLNFFFIFNKLAKLETNKKPVCTHIFID